MTISQFGVSKNTCERRDKIKHILKNTKGFEREYLRSISIKKDACFYPDARTCCFETPNWLIAPNLSPLEDQEMGNACSQTVEDVVVVVVVNRSHIGSEWDKSGLGDKTKGLGAGKRGGYFHYHHINDGAVRRKFWKEPLRGTKILSCGRGMTFFHP